MSSSLTKRATSSCRTQYKRMKYWVYILEGKDGYLYTGMTFDIAKRFREHTLGLSTVTKSKRSLKLIYKEEFKNKFLASIREKEIRLDKK